MDFARRIYEGLKGEVSDSGGKVVLQRTFQAYSDGVQSQAQGAALKATLVIWGWYDDGGVSPRIELLRIPSLATQPLDLPFIVTSAFAAEPAAASPALKLRDVAHYIRTPLTMGSTTLNRGQVHQGAISALTACDLRPRRLGGDRLGKGTR